VPPVLPTSSTNVPIITGTWNPSIITTAASGTVNYVFTPNPVAFPCATTKTLSITVNSLKEPNFVDLNVCSGGVMPPLNTRSPNGISGTWTPSSINNVSSGTYDFTPNPNQCATLKKTINVTVSPSATLVNVDWTVTDAFVTNQILTVSASGTGNYLYQLDSGPFQENPVFENVAFGTHSITVKDLYGCSASITIKDVLVINYPKYFTPNGDGFNDTWNIFTLKDQLNSRIYIFDRYGKLMKDLSTQGFGWDGMYNGQPVPADDYWFSVEYVEQDISKKFKSHFSLKR
jgi:gliding motility-associated-like protein